MNDSRMIACPPLTRSIWLRALLFVACLCVVAGVPRTALAETLQAALGSRAFELGSGRVACKPPGSGWQVERGGKKVRPPAGSESIGQPVDVLVAADLASCAKSASTVTLLATDHFPVLDSSSVTLFVDDARVEVRGRGLNGMILAWRTSSASGADVCREPKVAGAVKLCSFAVGSRLSAAREAVDLRFIPAGGRSGPDVTTFGEKGDALGPDVFVLPAARVVLSDLVPTDAAVDLSSGQDEIPLAHPEATAGVQCSGVACSLRKDRLVVRGKSSWVTTIDVTWELSPHVYYKNGDTLEERTTLRLSVLLCPMTVAGSGALRSADVPRVVLRFQGRCAHEVDSLRFFSGTRPLEVAQTVTDGDASWVALNLGSLESSSLTISAVRGEGESVPVAVANVVVEDPPRFRSTLEVPGYRNLAFIPNNRYARVHISRSSSVGALVPLPIEGVYRAIQDKGRVLVRGDPDAAGLAALRFGYRILTLPPPMNQLDLAVLNEPLQRPIREANIPANIGATTGHGGPLFDVACPNDKGMMTYLVPGKTDYLSFSARDSCRLILHRNRLDPKEGTQRLLLQIDVFRADGSVRGEAHVDQTLVVRAGHGSRIWWLHGVEAPFDRISVRISHVADESHYLNAEELLAGEPALKWTAVLGNAKVRWYGTTAIPTGLYRFGDKDHSGVLSLNFGVISRLTWMNPDGSEGFLGAEVGLMVIGLAGAESTTGRSLTQIGTVAGLGMSMPVANRSAPSQASINLHAWFERDIRASAAESTDRGWAIIFGPSITIGNVGANF